MIGAWTASIRVGRSWVDRVGVCMVCVWLSRTRRLAYSCRVSGRRSASAIVVLLTGLLLIAAFAREHHVSAAAGPADAGTVYRVQGRHGQQAGALGQDRRVHEAGGGRIRPRAAAASWARRAAATRSSPSRSAPPDTIRNLDRYKQLAAPALLPGRRADRRASATRSSASGKVVVLVTCSIHATEIGADADGARAGPPARDRRLAGDPEDPRQRHPRCSCRA